MSTADIQDNRKTHVICATVGFTDRYLYHENLEVILKPKEVTLGAFFNEVGRNSDNDSIILYLPKDCFPNKDFDLDKVVSKLVEYPMMLGVYTDDIIDYGDYKKYEFNPPFNRLLALQGKLVINSPIFVRGSVAKKKLFHENIEHLFMFDLFTSISKIGLLTHIPDTMFTMNYKEFNPTEDIKIITNEKCSSG